MALIHTALGDKDAAFSWLNRASRDADVWLLYARVDPRLDALRSDPRLEQLLRQLAL